MAAIVTGHGATGNVFDALILFNPRCTRTAPADPFPSPRPASGRKLKHNRDNGPRRVDYSSAGADAFIDRDSDEGALDGTGNGKVGNI